MGWNTLTICACSKSGLLIPTEEISVINKMVASLSRETETFTVQVLSLLSRETGHHIVYYPGVIILAVKYGFFSQQNGGPTLRSASVP